MPALPDTLSRPDRRRHAVYRSGSDAVMDAVLLLLLHAHLMLTSPSSGASHGQRQRVDGEAQRREERRLRIVELPLLSLTTT